MRMAWELCLRNLQCTGIHAVAKHLLKAARSVVRVRRGGPILLIFRAKYKYTQRKNKPGHASAGQNVLAPSEGAASMCSCASTHDRYPFASKWQSLSHSAFGDRGSFICSMLNNFAVKNTNTRLGIRGRNLSPRRAKYVAGRIKAE